MARVDKLQNLKSEISKTVRGTLTPPNYFNFPKNWISLWKLAGESEA
jgi:hypothetical protein